VREAANALDGNEKTIIHTENQKSGWWRAKFKNGSFKVNQVKLLNRPDGWGARLGDATLEIDGKECGKVQSSTKQNAWYTVTCTKPIIGRTIKVTSKAGTPLHFAEIRVFGTANNQCKTDSCDPSNKLTPNHFLLKSGKCQACPSGYVHDPQDKTKCVYGHYIREIKCKRGHRVDQLQITNFAGTAGLSHKGWAGGAWREDDQIVKLNADEYVKRVDGHHVASGRMQGQLAKIVYFTNKDRMISCFNKNVKYSTEKKTMTAASGEFIKFINQDSDSNRCCGRITSIVTDTLKKSFTEALDDEAVQKCPANQHLLVEGQKRSCAACKTGWKRHPDSIYKCILDCPEYKYLKTDVADNDQVSYQCVSDTCTDYESLGKDGKCHACQQAQSLWPAAVKLTAIPLTNAKMSSTWCCKHLQQAKLSAEFAIDGKKDTMAHTAGGRGHWWSADFKEGTREVTKVKITNRQDCCGDRLAKTRVYIDDVLCGQVPDTTKTGDAHEIVCAAPITGSKIVIRHDARYAPLQLAIVEAFGNDNCNHDERLNGLGPHRCTESSHCQGKRTCSKFRWCQGQSGCAAAAVPKERPTWLLKTLSTKSKCADVDTEEYDKEFEMTSAEECAAAVVDAGFKYFQYQSGTAAKTETQAACKACKSSQTVAIDAAHAEAGISTFETYPNYPLQLKDPQDNKKCVMTCDPRLPWDAALGACMSRQSAKEFTCHHDARGFLTKVRFVSEDGTVSDSSTAPDAATAGQIRHTLNVGEKINKVNVGTLEAKYDLQGGACVLPSGAAVKHENNAAYEDVW